MKKIALAMAAATAVFASNAAYNYEVTPTIGGVHPEGNLRVKDHNFVGVRAARNLEDFFFDQVELGVDYTQKAKEKTGSLTREGRVLRYHANLVKDMVDFGPVSLYGLVGAGYEDVPAIFVKNEDGGFGQYGFGLR